MDPMTHGLAGAVIARAGFSRSLGKWGPVAGVLAALSPDADYILRLFGEEIFLRYHRGITHSLILLPVYSLFGAILFRRLYKTEKFLPLYLLCFLSLLSHVFLDLMTSFGTMALVPVTDRRLTWDLVFIVDLYFTGILFIPLLLGHLIKRYKIELGILSLCLLLLYTGLCIVNHRQALSIAERLVEAKGLSPHSVAALPQPFSPFKWVLLIDTGDTLYQSFIDIDIKGNDRHDKINMIWKKWPDSPWVQKARTLPGVGFYLWFARFPVALVEELPNGHHLVEFIDLRFDILRGRIPFTHRVEFNKEGLLVLEKFTTLNSFTGDYGRR